MRSFFLRGGPRVLAAAFLTLFASSTIARADDADLVRPRFALSGSFGYTRTFVDKATLGQTARQWPIGTSLGVGLDVRAGVQWTRWLGLDAQLFGETLVFFGQARAAVLVAVRPTPTFEVAAGVGRGQIYELNFQTGTKTANEWVGIARAEVLVPSNDAYVTYGVEAQLGRTTGGTVGADHTVAGARILLGVLFR